jgi:mono/diheme cytochrome c family protein
MTRMRFFFLAGLAVWAALASSAMAHPLVWDAMAKAVTAKAGDSAVAADFTVRNDSDQPVEIKNVLTSCHCTTAPPPRTPWIIAPGASDVLHVTVDLIGRRGGLTKTIYVGSSAGEQQLRIEVDIPPPPAAQREMNLQMAQRDRQAVFRGDCANCHAIPAQGKRGAALYGVACEICHTDDTRRATEVPDLAKPAVKRDEAFWRHWIAEGRDGTLMPAFAKKHGGPLDDAQIESLVTYLMETLPNEPVSK